VTVSAPQHCRGSHRRPSHRRTPPASRRSASTHRRGRVWSTACEVS